MDAIPVVGISGSKIPVVGIENSWSFKLSKD
jgi:hypothetical protein